MSVITSTPTPWHVGPHYKSDIESAHGHVAECGIMRGDRAIANAALIVHRVNSYEEIVAALKALTDACEADCGGEITDDCGDDESVGAGDTNDMALTFGMMRRARAALAIAEGRESVVQEKR